MNHIIHNMFIVADLHIHSKYSRATSKQTDLEHLDEAAKIKGVDVLSVGDFTHPAWFAEIKKKLKEKEPGLFSLGDSAVRFILTTEISCIYKKNDKVRKIHLLVFAPNLETVAKINVKLGAIGNLKADGRPILGLDAKELLKIVLDISPDCMVIPCHAWTPWFSIFGSRSGFDSIKECFDDHTKYIYGIETGLSSDPAMNWRLSALDNIALISCSDAHSPAKVAREACVFETELSYQGIIGAIKRKNSKEFLYTIEFFPEEGKYHYDGHRVCGIVFDPAQTKKCNGICPVCKKALVEGVLGRVEQLADRPQGAMPTKAIPFKRLIPLEEIIAEVFGVGIASKRVKAAYQNIIQNFGAELDILISSSLNGFPLPEVKEAILRVRQGKVEIQPGYDGVYGKIKIAGLTLVQKKLC